MFVCFEVWFLFFLPVGQLFHCCVFLRVRGSTETQLSCPVVTILLLRKIPNKCIFNLHCGGSLKFWGRICYYHLNFLCHIFRALCTLNSKASGDITDFLLPSKPTINFILKTRITVFIKSLFTYLLTYLQNNCSLHKYTFLY